ncbi:MAG: RNA polymerase subunit sigma-32 [Gammaproteobacteria bacterium HGW-Gammaproteobacteria-3]|nr:MAG: RNA polymerase subunit sigma-32 [Gammaproteobacteria bacterium HGW-Gammaproteobacteria-3]
MTQAFLYPHQFNSDSDTVSGTFSETGKSSVLLRSRSILREQIALKLKRKTSADAGCSQADEPPRDDDLASDIAAGATEAAVVPSPLDDLRGLNQNAPVLSNENFSLEARKMELARGNLVRLLLDSSYGLWVLADVFMNALATGSDISELICKNHCDSLVPVQNDHFVQDTAKQLEFKLRDCFEQIMNRPEDLKDTANMLKIREYLSEIHFLPNFLQQITATLAKLGRNQPLKSEDSYWLRRVQEQEQRMSISRLAMINGNVRLVTYIAKQYNNQTTPFADLIQDGTIGLIKAVDRYDLNRAVRFSTYAIYWIRQTISRSLVRQEKMVRLPYNIAAKASAVFEIMNNYLIQNNKWPSSRELAALCKLPEEEVKAIVANYQPVISLDASINDDDDLPEVMTTLEQNHFPQPLNILIGSSLKACLRKAVDTLPEREASIIKCRFGLDNDHEMTLQDIADKMSLTRERVRQIQNSALMKLKNNFSGELTDFLEPG